MNKFHIYYYFYMPINVNRYIRTLYIMINTPSSIIIILLNLGLKKPYLFSLSFFLHVLALFKIY